MTNCKIVGIKYRLQSAEDSKKIMDAIKMRLEQIISKYNRIEVQWILNFYCLVPKREVL